MAQQLRLDQTLRARVPGELLRALEAKAKAEERSISDMTRRLLVTALKAQEVTHHANHG